MSEAVTVERGSEVATIALNRPDTGNLLDREMCQQFSAALRHVVQDKQLRALVLKGIGPTFCLDPDFEIAVSGGQSQGQSPRQRRAELAALVQRVWDLEIPTIAAINGRLSGAGLALALACDLRLAVAGTIFTQPPAGVTAMADCGLSWLLPRTIGLGRASELLIGGRRVDADRAAQWGLVAEVVPQGELDNALRPWLEVLMERPTTTAGLIKRGLRRSLQLGFRQASEFEGQLQIVALEAPG